MPHLKFAGEQHGCGTDKLKRLPAGLGYSQIMISHLHSQIQRLMIQFKILLQRQTKRETGKIGFFNLVGPKCILGKYKTL